MNTTQNENLENEKVATEDTQSETVDVPADAEVTPEASEEILEEVIDEIAEEDSSESLTEEVADSNIESFSDEPAASAKVKKHKGFAFAGLLALVLVCAVLWIAYSGIFANKYATIYNTSNVPALYLKDGEVRSHQSNGKIQKITDAVDGSAIGYETMDLLSSTMLRSPDGSTTFYYENYDTASFTGDLYAMYNNKNKVLIDSGVASGLMCSADGKIVVYAKRPADENAQNVSLYVHKKGGKPQMLATNYTPSISPLLSYSAKYIAFAQLDAENNTNSLYVAKVSAFGIKPEKIADNVTKLYSVNDKGYAYFAQSVINDAGETVTSLCYASRNTEATVIAENPIVREDYFAQFSNSFAYYVRNEDGKVQFFSSKVGKEPQMLFEGSDFYLNPDIENKNYIFITINPEDQNLLDISRVNGKKLNSIAKDTSANGLNNVLNSRDFNKITYMRNFDETTYSGEFFINKTVLGFQKETKIADNVSLAISTVDLKHIAYFTDLDLNKGLGTLYLYDGKKSQLISEGVPYYSASFTNDGKKLFYLSNVSEDYATATLNMVNTKQPSKNIVVDNEITPVNIYEFMYAARTNGSVYYYKNYDAATGSGDLYFAKNGKNPVLVENSMSGLILE